MMKVTMMMMTMITMTATMTTGTVGKAGKKALKKKSLNQIVSNPITRKRMKGRLMQTQPLPLRRPYRHHFPKPTSLNLVQVYVHQNHPSNDGANAPLCKLLHQSLRRPQRELTVR